jgi:hypothetical protein
MYYLMLLRLHHPLLLTYILLHSYYSPKCTKDAPFEIVHTAERALANLFLSADAESCLEYLLPFSINVDLSDKGSIPALLSTLRTMVVLLERIPIASLRKVFPSLLTLFRTTLCHKSMDMRKATVFLLVEVHFLDEEFQLDEFSDSQQRLIRVYIERHPKNSRTMEDAVVMKCLRC